MSETVTLQIELPEGEANLLQDWARRQGLTVSELLLRLVQERGTATDALSEAQYQSDPLWGIVGLAHTDTSDGSEHHDHYLYPRDEPPAG